MSRQSESSSFGIVIIAAAVGFVTGLLLAPKSGLETRKDLKRQAKKYEKQARKGLEAARETADESKRGLKAVVEEAVTDAKELSADAKVRAKRTVEHAKVGAQNVETRARQAWGDRK